MQTRENPPYKGGCPKIGLDRRGGMNQNTPNPGLALRWPHPCSLPIEWGREAVPRMRTFDHEWYWTLRSGCRQGMEMGGAAILASGIMINSRGERRTKALEGTEEDNQQTPSNSGGETRGYRHSHHQSPHAFSGIFACGSGGSPGYGGWPLNKINSFHKTL